MNKPAPIQKAQYSPNSLFLNSARCIDTHNSLTTSEFTFKLYKQPKQFIITFKIGATQLESQQSTRKADVK